MKLTVKTLKGTHFQITVNPNDTVMAVKKNIEGIQGKDNYPCGQQLLIHNGKVLKDETTLADNKVSEDGFLVVMLSKSKSSGSAGASSAQGIPESAEVAVSVAHFPTNQTTETGAAPIAPVSGAPNSSPLNMFPQETLSGAAAGGLESLDFLRNNQQFQVLRSMVQSNPQILQPMLQELGKQNPLLLRQIQEHHAEFLQLINEPLEGSEGDVFDQAEQEMPHAISVTPAEQEAIQRLEEMGFERALVIEAFLACDRNEELAANYLLENAGDFED
ncbi:hypothetical protein ES332_A06G168200v1 [Gossypium tomentosum]|uniref:Ubiquitin receptor RAD23 n=1 Tax=Gossypium tomentosum TaxID=34277 RepID=A0A5D2Q545_GOSTO|nr:hypothetical protein ES332_A06G168200v1 [Gossypium tomentosum]